jgi:hypothetical protein
MDQKSIPHLSPAGAARVPGPEPRNPLRPVAALSRGRVAALPSVALPRPARSRLRRVLRSPSAYSAPCTSARASTSGRYPLTPPRHDPQANATQRHPRARSAATALSATCRPAQVCPDLKRSFAALRMSAIAFGPGRSTAPPLPRTTYRGTRTALNGKHWLPSGCCQFSSGKPRHSVSEGRAKSAHSSYALSAPG